MEDKKKTGRGSVKPNPNRMKGVRLKGFTRPFAAEIKTKDKETWKSDKETKTELTQEEYEKVKNMGDAERMAYFFAEGIKEAFNTVEPRLTIYRYNDSGEQTSMETAYTVKDAKELINRRQEEYDSTIEKKAKVECDYYKDGEPQRDRAGIGYLERYRDWEDFIDNYDGYLNIDNQKDDEEKEGV